MGAAAVQVDSRNKYERTTDLRRMFTHRQLQEAIRNDSQSNILELLPARTATSIRYGRGAKTAQAWNEDGKETKIGLPLKDGWYVPDGNPFAIPNGKKSNRDNHEALYLMRHQDREYNGLLGCGTGEVDFIGWERIVWAGNFWPDVSGVALIGRPEERSSLGASERSSLGDANVASDIAPIVRGVEQSGAATPLVIIPSEKLSKITDPKALAQRAEQLETAAKELTERLGAVLSAEAYARLIKPTLDEAAFLRELAGKIEAIQQKA